MRIAYGIVPATFITHKIVRNPNYSGKAVGPFGWRAVPLVRAPKKEGFHAALEDSIRREGMRNPVVLYKFDGVYYLGFGGSRVLAAQRVGRAVEAIVNDFDDDGPNDITPENVEDFFRDPPQWYEFTDRGFDYHYSIERNRRESFDPAGLTWIDTLDEDAKAFLDEEFSWLKR